MHSVVDVRRHIPRQRIVNNKAAAAARMATSSGPHSARPVLPKHPNTEEYEKEVIEVNETKGEEEGSFPHPRRFALLYAMLVGVYMLRTAVSASVPRILRMHPELGLSFVGDLATFFSISYSLGKVTGGMVADYMDPKRLLSMCLAATVVCNLAFEGMMGWLSMQCCLWACAGYMQGIAWLPASKLLTQWWRERDRSMLWGILSSSQTVGSII